MTGDGEPGSGWRQGPSVAVVAAATVSALMVVGLAVAILLLMRDPVGGGIADGGAGNAGDVSGVNADGTGGGASSSSSDSPSDPPSDAPPSDAPPAVLEQCSDSGEAGLPRSGRGSEATSCEFAVAVHQAYFRTARPGDPAMVEAFSPATGQRYEMGCVENHNDGGIICRGGENAVVILY